MHLVHAHRRVDAEILDRGHRAIDMAERFGETPFEDERGDRTSRSDADVAALGEAGELVGGGFAEACGQRRGRAAGEIADTLEAGAAECLRILRIEFEGIDRQCTDCRSIVARVRACRVGGVGKSGPDMHPQPPEPGDQIVAQRFLAAEQMRAAADVEDQAIGAVDRDHRRIAVAAIGDALKPGGIGLPVNIDGDDVGLARAGIGEGQPRRHADRHRRPADRDQPHRTLDLFDQNKG